MDLKARKKTFDLSHLYSEFCGLKNGIKVNGSAKEGTNRVIIALAYNNL